MNAARPTGSKLPPLWQIGLWLQGLVGSRYDGLRHFSVVVPGRLLRSGQPRVRDLEEIRRQHGLKTIVAARGGTRHPLRGAWFRKERAFCARAGVRLEHMPFSDSKSPPVELFDRFVRLARDPDSWPILVHCEQGFHRTGVLVGAYRLAIDGWDMPRVLAEMESAGFEMIVEKRQGLLDALRAWNVRRSPASNEA